MIPDDRWGRTRTIAVARNLIDIFGNFFGNFDRREPEVEWTEVRLGINFLYLAVAVGNWFWCWCGLSSLKKIWFVMAKQKRSLTATKNVPQVDPTRHRWMLEVRRSLLNVSIAWVMLLITSVCSSHHHHQAFGVLDKRPQRSLIVQGC